MGDISIFDLTNISDIPLEIAKTLKINKKNSVEENIIALFKMAERRLSIDEVTIAYYRYYKKAIDRK